MRSTRNILLVTNMWPHGADPSYGAFIKEQAESLRTLGVDYDFVFINGRESTWNYARGVRDIHHALSLKHYDLVHAHFGLSGCVARFQFKVPLVVTFHGDDVLGRPKRSGRITLKGRFFQTSSFLLARSAAAVIVQSEEMKRKLRLARAEVIPGGIDLDLFRPVSQREAREKLRLPLGTRYVLFPYNPAEAGKRFDLIEEAVQLASREAAGIEILQVRGRPHSDMPLYVNASDIFVMASLSEGSPMAVKEAMAVNLPVVSVRVGDVAELIGETRGCYLVERNAAAIARKIAEVCRLGQRTNGREAISRLAMDNIARRVVGVYERVLRA